MIRTTSFYNRLGLALALCIVATVPAYSKARPPDTGLGIRESDVIAVIKVTSVVPASGDDSRNGYYGCVQATILETIKGKPASSKVSILTKRWGHGAEEWADAGAFCPEHTYLVFLKRNGKAYNAYFGSFGVFPIDDKCRVIRWSKPGVQPPPFATSMSTDYDEMKQQVKKYLASKGLSQPNKGPVFNCSPLRTDSGLAGPSMKTIAQQSNLIAVIEARWVKPADQPENKKAKLHSRVDAQILEVLKGSARSKSIVIGTTLEAKLGDAGAFCPMRRQLVFLKQDGSLYRTVHGRCGVFEIDGPYVIGWPQRGGSCWPRPSSRVGLQSVRKEISGFLSFLDKSSGCQQQMCLLPTQVVEVKQ